MTADERTAFEAMQNDGSMSGVDHHAPLQTAPQTFAYGWNDSPRGGAGLDPDEDDARHHFVAMEAPTALAADMGSFFGNLS